MCCWQAHYSDQEAQILQIFSDLPEDADDVDVASDDEDEDAAIHG